MQPAPAAAVRNPRGVLLLLAPLVVGAVSGFFVDGEFGYFLKASLQVAPFAALCVLAYIGLERSAARVGAWLLLGGLLASLVLVNLIFVLWAREGTSSKVHHAGTLPPGAALSLVSVLGFSAVMALLAVLPCWRAWRRFHGLPSASDGWTSVHTLALAAVSSLALGCIVPLLVLGEPPLLLMLRQPGGSQDLLGLERGAIGMNLDALYALCWTLVASALAVGYGVRRDWAGTFERLGLRRVTGGQVGIALGLTAALLAVMLGVEWFVTRAWDFLEWPTTDTDAFKSLLAPLITPIGAVVIGITAGVGEEVAVRGILQPRLGILLSNAFFTALHAYQYNWDALLSVFLVGLVLGVIRKKTNTTVSAIVHGSYDFVLVMFEFVSG